MDLHRRNYATCMTRNLQTIRYNNSMLSKLLLTTIGYTITTFALAVVWHLILFGDIYEKNGYIGR